MPKYWISANSWIIVVNKGIEHQKILIYSIGRLIAQHQRLKIGQFDCCQPAAKEQWFQGALRNHHISKFLMNCFMFHAI